MCNVILIHSASHAYIMDWLMGKRGRRRARREANQVYLLLLWVMFS